MLTVFEEGSGSNRCCLEDWGKIMPLTVVIQSLYHVNIKKAYTRLIKIKAAEFQVHQVFHSTAVLFVLR